MIRIFIESGVNSAISCNKETTNEEEFIKKFIQHHFKGIVYKIDFEIYGIGGYTNLENSKPSLEDKKKQDVNLVIFDADGIYNGGGFDVRKKAIIEMKERMGVDFELFLWPNNHDDGDFESLLLQMINNKHQGVLDCYDSFVKCVERRDSKGKLYELPGRKAEMYTYIDIMRLSKKERDKLHKGYYLFDNDQYWDLDAKAANSLRDFLLPYIEPMIEGKTDSDAEKMI